MISGLGFNRAQRPMLATLLLILGFTTRALVGESCSAQTPPPIDLSLENAANIVHEPIESSADVLADDKIGLEEIHASPAIDFAEGVRAMFREYVVAFNEQNAQKMTSKWKQDGIFIDQATGERTVGRESILRRLQTLFQSRTDLVMGGRVDDVRFVRPDVACVTGFVTTAGDDDEPLESSFTAIAVCDDGAWRIDTLEEVPSVSTATSDERLSKLDVLVGSWQDLDGEEAVTTNTQWGANRSFLVRSYWIERGPDDARQSTEVIGWDPHREVIRSWTFDSDGSFGESVWQERDRGWDVKITQTLADGRVAAATQAITVIDPDTLSVQFIGEEIAGNMRPSSPPVRVQRKSVSSVTEASVTK